MQCCNLIPTHWLLEEWMGMNHQACSTAIAQQQYSNCIAIALRQYCNGPRCGREDGDEPPGIQHCNSTATVQQQHCNSTAIELRQYRNGPGSGGREGARRGVKVEVAQGHPADGAHERRSGRGECEEGHGGSQGERHFPAPEEGVQRLECGQNGCYGARRKARCEVGEGEDPDLEVLGLGGG